MIVCTIHTEGRGHLFRQKTKMMPYFAASPLICVVMVSEMVLYRDDA
jgi:hypothetical protein